MESNLIIGILALAILYLLSIGWAYFYWSKYAKEHNADIMPEEAQLIVVMLLLWFIYWNEIKIVIDHADKYED